MSIAQLTNSTAKLQGFSAILTRKSPKNRRLKLKRDCRPASVSPPYLHDYFMSFSAHLCAPFSNVLKSKQRFDITCSGLSYSVSSGHHITTLTDVFLSHDRKELLFFFIISHPPYRFTTFSIPSNASFPI